MSTYDNQPPQDFWYCESRPCPIPCRYCVAANDVDVPANCELGEN
ncbi:MAG: hypothetical protein ACXVGA_04275 [Mycobacteriaceae bacterium]